MKTMRDNLHPAYTVLLIRFSCHKMIELKDFPLMTVVRFSTYDTVK